MAIPPPPAKKTTNAHLFIPPPPPPPMKRPKLNLIPPPPPKKMPKVDRFDGLREVFYFLRENERGATVEDAEKKLGYPCRAKIRNLQMQGYVVDTGRKKQRSPIWLARAD